MFQFSQLVKVAHIDQALANHLRLIQKSYFKYPKQTSYYKDIKQDLGEFIFQFQCYQNRMNFEQKLEILESVVRLKPNTLYGDIMGVKNILLSLSAQLQTTQYNDDVELNISQYINILHSIGFYDQVIWFSAIDNYHKQGNLNWVQYKSFTDSIFYFQRLLKEDWQNNIVRDISQEAWNDFVGFVENSERLEIEPQDLLNTYQNIRKFKQFATPNNLRTIITYYGKHLERKKRDPSYNTQKYIDQFLLLFVFDHVQQKELLEGLGKLFGYLMLSIYQEYEGYKKLFTLIEDPYSYISMLRLSQEFYFHNLLEPGYVVAWSQEMYKMFSERKLNGDIYNLMENLIQLKFVVQQLRVSFFEDKQVDNIIQEIDQQALENLKLLKSRPQNLYSLINFYKTYDDEGHQQEYLNVLGKSHLTLENVTYSNTDLMQCMEELDDQDMVYYLNDLLESILRYVALHVNDYSPEDWSLTYYIVFKYLVKGNEQQDFEHLTGDLEILKHNIKLTFISNYRRPIPLSSNYYKILSVVELETFYADDIINYY